MYLANKSNTPPAQLTSNGCDIAIIVPVRHARQCLRHDRRINILRTIQLLYFPLKLCCIPSDPVFLAKTRSKKGVCHVWILTSVHEATVYSFSKREPIFLSTLSTTCETSQANLTSYRTQTAAVLACTTAMTSRLPSTGARLSTAPSSIKPRQLVRTLLPHAL